MISYEDFAKVDIRVGKIISAEEFPEAKIPAYKLVIDCGSEFGNKKSSAQIALSYTKEELIGKHVLVVVNFPPKQVGPFMSEVLTLGFRNAAGEGYILASVDKETVVLGERMH